MRATVQAVDVKLSPDLTHRKSFLRQLFEKYKGARLLGHSVPILEVSPVAGQQKSLLSQTGTALTAKFERN